MPRPQRTTKTPLPSDTRGAVYVEFLIAFMPVFVFFLCILQLALLFGARLMVDHSAVNGARAAAVVFGDRPELYEDETINVLGESRRRAVRDAVILSLAPMVLDGTVTGLQVAFPEERGGPDRADRDAPVGRMFINDGGSGTTLVRVRVEAEVVCKIAIANAIVCGLTSNERPIGRRFGAVTMKSEAIFPYQGAGYAYANDDDS
jgi:hypothetical protein